MHIQPMVLHRGVRGLSFLTAVQIHVPDALFRVLLFCLVLVCVLFCFGSVSTRCLLFHTHPKHCKSGCGLAPRVA